MTRNAMINEMKAAGIVLINVKKMNKADVEKKYAEYLKEKEDTTMTNNVFTPATERLPETIEKYTVYGMTSWSAPAAAPTKKERKTRKKETPHAVITQGLTGAYTNDLEFLAHIVQDAIPEIVRTSFTIHADPKKKKLMVRWSGKSMLFKVFIQRKNYKVHLKHEEDWATVPFEHNAPFFQNGFNLPWAVKMNDDQFAQFLQWIFTTV